jgi:hypothetical protein
MAAPFAFPYLNLCGLIRFSIPSRNRDQTFVLNGAGHRFVSVAPQAGHPGSASPIFMIISKRCEQRVHS